MMNSTQATQSEDIFFIILMNWLNSNMHSDESDTDSSDSITGRIHDILHHSNFYNDISPLLSSDIIR